MIYSHSNIVRVKGYSDDDANMFMVFKGSEFHKESMFLEILTNACKHLKTDLLRLDDYVEGEPSAAARYRLYLKAVRIIFNFIIVAFKIKHLHPDGCYSGKIHPVTKSDRDQ